MGEIGLAAGVLEWKTGAIRDEKEVLGRKTRAIGDEKGEVKG